MKGSRILVSSKPRGVFDECKIVGTPKPGTVMEIKPSTEPVDGVFSYQAYGTQAASGGHYVSADGDKKCIAVLLEDDKQGKTYDDAYADGDRGYLYFPAMGEQLNMIFQVQAGTGDTFVIGQEMMVDDGTGKLVTAGADVEAHPFTCLETEATALTADEHKWCRFNGVTGA